MARVAIVGSRDYGDIPSVWVYVSSLDKDDIVVSGGAIGVDSAAEDAAKDCGLRYEVYPPDYTVHGRGAPFVRNRKIAESCDRLVAFWDGKSMGTQHVINCAKKLGKPVKVIR